MAGKQDNWQNGTPVLSLSGVTYAFDGGPPLVEDLSFHVLPGEFVTFLAPSGIGKSTLFRLIAGLLEPQAGEIRLKEHMEVPSGGDGKQPAKTADTASEPGLTASRPRLGRVGFMPQRDCLMPWRTVLDNAALGLELAGQTRREARRRVRELLPSFGLEGTEARYPRELSGGMRQRVSFLRTVLCGSDILLLDEPFSALDGLTRASMQEWLLDVWERQRKTVLFITHDVDEAILLSDRVLIAAHAPVRSLHEVTVSLPRPRSYGVTMEAAFLALKKQVLAMLHQDGGVE